jgi:hypothetical protein
MLKSEILDDAACRRADALIRSCRSWNAVQRFLPGGLSDAVTWVAKGRSRLFVIVARSTEQ